MTQLEQPIDAAFRALEIAKSAGVTTILNPAPAAKLPENIFALCDYVTPNETETEELTGIRVETVSRRSQGGREISGQGCWRGAHHLGEKGALLHDGHHSELTPAFSAGPVVETTGAGDAFNGGFAVGLSRGL